MSMTQGMLSSNKQDWETPQSFIKRVLHFRCTRILSEIHRI